MSGLSYTGEKAKVLLVRTFYDVEYKEHYMFVFAYMNNWQTLFSLFNTLLVPIQVKIYFFKSSRNLPPLFHELFLQSIYPE